jgi:hypothetical protein
MKHAEGKLPPTNISGQGFMVETIRLWRRLLDDASQNVAGVFISAGSR